MIVRILYCMLQLRCGTRQSLNILGAAFGIGHPFKDGWLRLVGKEKVKEGLVQSLDTSKTNFLLMFLRWILSVIEETKYYNLIPIYPIKNIDLFLCLFFISSWLIRFSEFSDSLSDSINSSFCS